MIPCKLPSHVKPSLSIPSRQIHLDFHTSPWIPGVGSEFDAREFASTMKAAHVNSVTVFAKCHHGHLYYNTQRPERHPGLKPGLDLLREQVEALHREGIRAPIYLSVQCDEYAANTHPEWVARNPDSSQVKWWPPMRPDKVFAPGWQILDMSSPYQDFLAEQTSEVLKLFKPVDGIFFDICRDLPSTTQWAMEGMRKAGLNPEEESHRARYARQVALAYCKRFHQMVKASSRNATVFFNGRPFPSLGESIQFFTHTEIEALATGGWGYIFFPKNVRFARTFPKPYIGMTARFHKSWADFGGLKPAPALEYEISQMMAHGAQCSIGDQMHPRGTLDRGAYALIGAVYRRVAEREPWTGGAQPVVQIGLFQLPAEGLHSAQATSGTDEGATRLLTQLKHQFDVVGPASDFSRYDLLILPDAIPLDATLTRRLRAYVKKGGSLLATGTSGLSADGRKLLLTELGIAPHGPSPFSVTYLRFGNAIHAGVPDSDHVMYERGIRVVAKKGAQTLARVVEPYFERAWNHFCSHYQTPSDKVSRYAAAVRNGRCAYIPFPIFNAYAQHGNAPYRLLVGNLLNLMLPEPLLTVGAPTSTEATVMRQGRRWIVHLLQYCAERRATGMDLIEDIVPLYNIPLSLRCAKPPKQVYLAPERETVPFTHAKGRVDLIVPEIRGHAMVVFE